MKLGFVKLKWQYIICSIMLFFSVQQSWAQDDTKKNIFLDLTEFNASEGRIHIYQTPDLRLLFNDYIDQKEKEKGFAGYRIQIFSRSGHTARTEANKIRNEFVSKYPDYKIHILYEDPNFKLRIGDFRTKTQALEVLEIVKENYKGAYLVKDYVQWAESKE